MPGARCALFAGAAICAPPATALAAADDDAPTVSGVAGAGRRRRSAAPTRRCPPRPSTRTEIAATVNATTVEDALKYLPAIFVRRRHIGDTQAPITTRTSGVGASARSLIYADGVLLSALIGNNNSTASPRWGMVAPEEIERIDVLYGPFSAAYPGNSIGAVVNITTRESRRASKPRPRSASAPSTSSSTRPRTTTTPMTPPPRWATGAGPFSWRISANHLETRGQPLSYITATRPPAASTAGTAGHRGLRRPATARARRSSSWAPAAWNGRNRTTPRSSWNGRSRLRLTASYLAGYFGNQTEAHVGELPAQRRRRDGLLRPAEHQRLRLQCRAQRLRQRHVPAGRAALDAGAGPAGRRRRAAALGGDGHGL